MFIGDSLLCGDFLKYPRRLEYEISRLCIKSKSTISIAESCTGGMISSRITNVPGSSQYFLGGFVVYSNDAKVKFLDVPPLDLQKFGAVSPQVAHCMAEGVRRVFMSSVGLSVTGIAGPGGGTEEKQVGLVYIGVSDSKKSSIYEYIFKGDRRRIREETTLKALEILKQSLERSVGIQND